MPSGPERQIADPKPGDHVCSIDEDRTGGDREELYCFLMENTHDAISLTDIEGRRVYASPSLRRLLGWVPESPLDGIHPDDLHAVRESWERGLAGEKTVLTFRHAHADGSWRWLESSGSLVQFRGRPHVLAVTRDVTERVRSEEALRKSARVLREAEILGQTGSWEYDAATGAIFATEGYLRNCFGDQPDRGRRPEAFSEAIHPDDRGPVWAQWDQLLAGSGRRDFEYRVVWPDGRVRVLSISATVVRDEAGKAVRAYGTSRDVTELKRAEEQLRRAEEQARQVIDAIPQQIWCGPADGSIDYCNRQWRVFTGIALEDVQGHVWQRVLHPDDRERVVNAWRESVANGTSYEQEERHRRADGVYRWFLCRGVPLRDSAGRIERWYGTNTDIEDRKRAEEDLRRSEEQLRLVVDAIPVMAWTVRPDGVVDFLNRRWLDYSGLSLEQYVADPTGPIHPDDVARILSKWRVQMEAGEAYDDEMRLRRADGEYRWFLVRTAPVRDEHGRVVKWYGVSTDVEDRKRAEEEVRERRELLQSVLATLPVGVVVTNPAGDIVLANEASKRIWGEIIVSGRERRAQSQGYWHESGERIEPEAWASVRAIRDGQTTLNELLDIETFDGEKKIIQNSAAPVRDADGTIVGAVVVNEDVTERVRAREKLKLSERRLAEAQRVAHIGSWEWNPRTDELTWSDELYQVFGVPPEFRLSYEAFLNLVAPTDRERVRGRVDEAIRERRGFEGDFQIIGTGKGARVLYHQASMILDEAGLPIRLVGTCQDVTERERAEEALRDSANRLQQLTHRLLAVQEEERRHIARELHDEFGQILASVTLHLHAARGAAGEAAQAPLDECAALLRRAGEQVRGLALRLRPTMLETAGLDAALRWLADEHQRQTGIATSVEGHLNGVSGDLAIACFRVAQEALTNVVKHARAQRARIELIRTETELELVVRDGGVGFDVEETLGRAAAGDGLGLLGMRERVEILGGRLNVDSEPGRGTRIRASFPLTEPEE